MDVPQKPLFSLVLVAILFLSLGCSKNKTASTVFPKVTAECDDQRFQGRYIVRWEGGRVTLYQAATDQEILTQLVEPQLEQLQLVEPDYRVFLPQTAGSIPMQSSGLIDNWGPERIQADQAWAQGYRGGGITVAVIDSGVDISHLQLKNQVALNSKEIPDNGLDDDHNGFIDDVNGYDFTTNQGRLREAGAHGTHVSGIIAAEHSETVAGPQDHVQGVAPQSKILPLAFIGSDGSGSLYDAMRAIEYATDAGAQVINASWGGSGCSSIMRDQIGGLYGKKVIFVTAAGNSGLDIDWSPEYPAAFNLRSQLTVGATGLFDSRAQFSNYGDQAVHLFAPGVEVASTTPNQTYDLMSGTSMATPMVAGAVAVLLGARPGVSVDQVRQSLYASVHSDLAYRNFSHGRLNLGSALRYLLNH